MSPSTRRDALRWFAATAVVTAGCSGPDDPETSAEPSRETTTAPPDGTTQPEGTATYSPVPESTIDAVDGEWPSFAYDATNTGDAPSLQGPSELPRVQWHADVSASGSAPVVGGETVVVPTRDADLLALDATDGTERWQQDISRYGIPSPAIAGDLVLAANESLRAFSLDGGEERWSYGSFDELFGGLTVHEGTVYVCANEAVHAVDAASGERQWHTEFPDVGSTHGPVAVDDDAVVVRTSSGHDDGVVRLDPSTGEERWRTTFDGDLSPPRLAGESIYVGVERAYTDPFEDETVFEVDAATGEATPLFRTAGRLPPDVAVTDDRLIVFEHVDHPPDGPATASHTVLETDPDRTPNDSDDGKPTHVYGLDRDGTERWRTTVADETDGNGWSAGAPAVVGGVVYLVLSSGRVVALDPATGTEQWRVQRAGYRNGGVGPAVVDGVVFVGSADGVLALA